MTDYPSNLSILFVGSFVFTYLVIPVLRQIIIKQDVFNSPTKRDLHKTKIPKLIGIAFYFCIVLCSKGYPDAYKKNIEIFNLDKFKSENDNFLFHAGTLKKNDKIFSVGGRVLNFISLSDDFGLAKKNIINKLEQLNWDGGFYRKDIGYKVIK